MAKTILKPNAELDLLSEDELRAVLGEFVSGYLRPPDFTRDPNGVDLDGSGDGSVTFAAIEAGHIFIVTRMEFSVDGYDSRAPFNPSSEGGIDLYVNGQWRDGYQFGGTSGGLLPATYVESESRAIRMFGGDIMTVTVGGGPASTGFSVALCGLLTPEPPIV